MFSRKVLRSSGSAAAPLMVGVLSSIVVGVSSYVYSARQWMRTTPVYMKERNNGGDAAALEGDTKYGDSMSKS